MARFRSIDAIPTRQQRYRGCLVGLAIGDALGAPFEGVPPRSPITVDLPKAGSSARKGYWTDDTSLALCLAESLLDKRGFDPVDQMERYSRWLFEGYLSSRSEAFGMGRTTSRAIVSFKKTGQPYSGPIDPMTAGNGSLMRLAPVALYYEHDPVVLVQKAGLSSKTTHGAEEAVDACRYFSSLLFGALQGVSKKTLLAPGFSPLRGLWRDEPLSPRIAEIADGSFKVKAGPPMQGSAYVVETLRAALWAFWKEDDFLSGLEAAIKLGGDTDTTGAVFGQLAGAYYGESSIPRYLIDWIVRSEEIRDLADRLFQRTEAAKTNRQDL